MKLLEKKPGCREACLECPAVHRLLLTAASVRCRCIQRADQPIILTGYSALNKLLGRDVYSSHLQLGGPKVLATFRVPLRAHEAAV